jgi:hypothetical protein
MNFPNIPILESILLENNDSLTFYLNYNYLYNLASYISFNIINLLTSNTSNSYINSLTIYVSFIYKYVLYFLSNISFDSLINNE